MSQRGSTEAGAKPQASLLTSPVNKILFLSHTVYKVFPVTPGARRKEGGVHSGPGFEDGPCRLQPGGSLKSHSFAHTSSHSVPLMAPSQVVVLAKQGL